MWGLINMNIVIYGEVALDWLISQDEALSYRIGGAGLYAALSSAKSGGNVELLTIIGAEIDDYYKSVWNGMGVSFKHAKNDEEYNISNYLVTGFENYQKKTSIPVVSKKFNHEYSPTLPEEYDAILIFPINHSIPKDMCIKAKSDNKMVFLDPKPNQESIADAREVLEYVDVLLVNEEELSILSDLSDTNEGIKKLLGYGIKYVIVKRGIKGCILAESDKELSIIPAYRSNAVCTLGSGDVFGGALATIFIETGNMEYSVKYASCMAASFIESMDTEQMPSKRAVEKYLYKRESMRCSSLKNITIYLAGPFFSRQELYWVNLIHKRLEAIGLSVLSPSRENGIIGLNSSVNEKKDIFNMDLKLLKQSDVVIALLDHNDSGTSFEIGYAYSNNIPIIGLKTSDDKLNNMIQVGCNAICNSIEELIEEVYKYVSK